LNCPTRRVESQVGLLCRALHGTKGRPHCSTFLHAPSLDACSQDPSWPVLGWITLASGGSRVSYPSVDRTYQLCHLQATVIETEEHFIFRFPIYYEIEGQYYHVFRDSRNSLSILFQYPDQRFIALFMKDALGLRSQSLRPPPRPDTTRMITSLITVLPAYTGTKRHHQSGLVQS